MKLILLLLIPAMALGQGVNFKIKLDFDNSSCKNGNVCTMEVFRTICDSATTCPEFVNHPDWFSAMPKADSTNSSQVVGAANTHFTYYDNDKGQFPLQYNAPYVYAVRNTFTANPSNPGPTSQIVITTPTGQHSAVISWTNASCRTASPCTLQVYRAICSPSCPTYTPGNTAWTKLDMTANLVTNSTAQSTTWTYTDQKIIGSTTYAWIATNLYTGGTKESPASTAFSGTTTVGKSTNKENQK